MIFNKFSLQLIIATFMIGMAIIFLCHEHLEVLSICEQLAQSNPWFITLGIVLTGIYLLLQAQMYVYSFRSIGTEVPILVAPRLFCMVGLDVFTPYANSECQKQTYYIY